MDKMKAYFGLAILFGVHNQPRYRNYWSSNPLLGNSAVQKVITLRRYQKISEYLHVTDREREHPRGHPSYSKLAKIQWLLDYLNDTFSRIKHPNKNQSVDVNMCSLILLSLPKEESRPTYIHVQKILIVNSFRFTLVKILRKYLAPQGTKKKMVS